MKFGGGLIDLDGTNIPSVLERISEVKRARDFGAIAVFSAPKGVTDDLQSIGESRALGRDYDLDSIFSSYSKLASHIVRASLLNELQGMLDKYRNNVEEALSRVDRRFNGSIRARVLATGGELPTAALMSYALISGGVPSCFLDKATWPIITDDNFENASPDFEMSSKKLPELIQYIEEKRVVSVGGFMGVTHDGLETLLGRGGSDQTAVFLSILLRDHYEIETILFKETPIRSAAPEIIKDQQLHRVSSMTYNEAQKATISGMNIVQNAAVRIARSHKLPLTVAPLSDPRLGTSIQSDNPKSQPIKCVTGLSNCAIITMSEERSRSLQDCLVLWEGYDAFLDLGAEVMDTGQVLRDLLVLDANFVRENEERLRSFDKDMKIEYGLGVVTLVGDRMRDTPGVASIAISSIPRINIKRGVFAPHTSQIMLVVNEADVSDAIRKIHRQLNSEGLFGETTHS